MIALLLLLALGGLMQVARDFAPLAGAAGVELAFGFLLLSAFFSARLLHRLGLRYRLTGGWLRVSGGRRTSTSAPAGSPS